MTGLLVLSILTLAASLWAAAEITIGLGRMHDLAEAEPFGGDNPPWLTVVVPACNEADSIEPALLSLLQQDYPYYEIIAVNDRSTDRTAEVLQSLQSQYPRLKVLTIRDLPDGWLGKNHALHQGAELATGDYLLFTDADVVLEKTCLGRAMTVMMKDRLDHLCLLFKNSSPGSLLNALILDAGGGLLLLFRPWLAERPASRRFMGVGAFNLVRAASYRQIGGHELIRMHPIDDIMLGKLIKEEGLRQQCRLGYDFVSVPWYETPRAMINGLMKNVFALYNFSVMKALTSAALIVVAAILPPWGLLFGEGWARFFFLLIIVARLYLFGLGCRVMRLPYRLLAWSFLTPYLNLFIVVRATVLTLTHHGIEWRGTHYPLARLRQNRPLL